MKLIPFNLQRRIEHRLNLVQILDNIGWLFFDRILRMGVGLLVGVWLARYLGPEQFGLINYAAAFVGLFGTLATLGLNSIVVRDLVRDPESANLTLGSAALLQFLGSLLAFALTVWAIAFFRPNDTLVRLAVVILGTLMLLKATEIAIYWFEAKVESKYTVWVQNAVFLAIAAVKIALILFGAPLIAFVWLMFAESALVAIALIAIFSLRGPGLRGLRVHFRRMLSLLRDSWPLVLAGVAITIYMKIDQIMLGQMIGDDAVGIYSAATRVSEVWYFIPMAIVASVFPTIIEAKRTSEEVYYRRLQQLYDLMVIMSVAVAIPMTFLSDWIILTLFGAAYQGAGTVLAIHVWASVFVFLGVASGKWFIVENRQILSLQRALLGTVVNVLLNLALIPRFGATGAAWATVLSYSVAALFFDYIQSETMLMYHMKIKSLTLVGPIKRLLGH